jgi:pimeloyl-ACP methyl ester carboxylesterase
VHGGFAHAHWWDFIAPLFAQDYRVAALDLSGMGDSDYRQKYSGDLFAQEVMEVCAQADFGNLPPVVVGHSFGGLVALKAGVHYGKKLTGVVLADFPIRPPDLQKEHNSRGPLVKPKEIYPSPEAARKRFRLIPAQPCKNNFILEHIAGHSLRKVNGGWSWKFDDKIFDGFEAGNISEDLSRVACRLAVIYGEHSALFPREVIDYMSGLLPNNTPVVVIRQAYHHLFLDQPLVFTEAIQELLKQWNYGKVDSAKGRRIREAGESVAGRVG